MVGKRRFELQRRKRVSTLKNAMVLSGFGKILDLPHNLEVVGSNPA